MKDYTVDELNDPEKVTDIRRQEMLKKTRIAEEVFDLMAENDMSYKDAFNLCMSLALTVMESIDISDEAMRTNVMHFVDVWTGKEEGNESAYRITKHSAN